MERFRPEALWPCDKQGRRYDLNLFDAIPGVLSRPAEKDQSEPPYLEYTEKL